MKKLIFGLIATLFSITGIASNTSPLLYAVNSMKENRIQLSYAILKTGDYCFKENWSCYITLVNSIGDPVEVLAVGYPPSQMYQKAVAVGFTAQVLHFNTSGLANATRINPIAKDLNQVYANGVPIVFEPGGYFLPFKGYGYGLGLTIQDNKTGLEEPGELKKLSQIFESSLKYALSLKGKFPPKFIYKSISPKALKAHNFQYFLAAEKTLSYCTEINFACAVATSNRYGAIVSMLSSKKVIPAYTVMAANRAKLSGLTGAPLNAENFFKHEPGQPIFEGNHLVGGVGAEVINLSSEPTEWRDYPKQIEMRFVQNFTALRKKYN